MFSGAHVVVYSKDAEADRAFFRDVLDMKHVDVEQPWGLLTSFQLPGGGKIGAYQPKHALVHDA